MEQRPFTRLANRPLVKDPTLRLVQKAIQDSLWRLIDGKKPTRFALRDLQAMANLDPVDPLSLPMPYQLDGKRLDPHALHEAIKTACDFLDFYNNENHKRLHQCQGVRKEGKGLYQPCQRYFVGRPDKKYCDEDCKDNYWSKHRKVSGKGREAVRRHRAKK